MPQPDISLVTMDIVSLKRQNVELHVLRLDKIHPVISGNKFFKLKYHLQHFTSNDYDGIVTFGGAWSNHIIATACMCAMNGIKSTGIIRGEKPPHLSHTLLTASEYGMDLHFIPRSAYSSRNDQSFLSSIAEKYPRDYLIPEGGAGPLGEMGISEMAKEFSLEKYDYVACSIGSGTMFRALKASLSSSHVLGFPAIKGYKTDDAHVFTGYHFGGYAKHNDDLIRFMNDFYKNYRIPTDIVYTGKMFFAINDLVSKGFFATHGNICCIHSGGLQGNLSLPNGTLMF